MPINSYLFNDTTMMNLSIVPEALDTHFMGTTWLIPTFIVFLSTIAITRDPKIMKKIMFPIAIGWHLVLAPVGINQNLLFLIITGIIFVSDIFTLEIIGTTIGWANTRLAERTAIRAQRIREKEIKLPFGQKLTGIARQEQIAEIKKTNQQRIQSYNEMQAFEALTAKDQQQLNQLYQQRANSTNTEQIHQYNRQIQQIQRNIDIKQQRIRLAQSMNINLEQLGRLDTHTQKLQEIKDQYYTKNPFTRQKDQTINNTKIRGFTQAQKERIQAILRQEQNEARRILNLKEQYRKLNQERRSKEILQRWGIKRKPRPKVQEYWDDNYTPTSRAIWK